MMKEIDAFITTLSEVPSTENFTNPYTQQARRDNLYTYLSYAKRHNVRVFLIGEAPGYRGCRLTGIPFTSPRTIQKSNAHFFHTHRNDLIVDSNISEASALAVWEVLEAHTTPVLLWNVFPFHPHEKGNTQTNRKPTQREIDIGVSFLELLFEMFNPDIIVAVGRVSEQLLAEKFSHKKHVYVRHPSYGGKTLFREKMIEILKNE